LIKVAVDAMGGDHAPYEIIKGAVEALAESPDLFIYLVGQEPKIRECLNSLQSDDERLDIVAAAEVISANDDPGYSMRRKINSSMVMAQKMVREGKADAILSAGNTGALMAGGLLFLGRIPGVSRPALLTVLPTFSNKGVVVLDVGANMDARPEQMVQYALMGTLYARQVLKYQQPRVALLNIGSEDNKGNDQAKKTFSLFKNKVASFSGNIEGNRVFDGKAEVVICDGFVGNVFLKTIEGLSAGILDSLKNEFTSSWINKMGAALLSNSFLSFRDKMDASEYGGAPLIGVKGICIKCHGSSQAKAIKMALTRQTFLLVKNQVNKEIEKTLKETNCSREGFNKNG